MARTYFILKAGIAPPGLASQPDAVKMMFWSWVVDLGLHRKDYELARGLNAKGEPLPSVALATRKHRRSEMTPSGKGDPSAPYLMPGRGLSRTRSLLAGKAHTTYAEFYWRYDPYTGDQWGRVLAFHAARGQSYNVVGLSPAGIAAVAQQAQKRWRQYLLSTFPSFSDVANPERNRRGAVTAQVSPVHAGQTNLTYATFGIGGTKEQAQRAIDEGRSSGFRTAAEWAAYFREKRPVPNLANPTGTSYSVRSGNSNVILQHLWGGPPPAAPSAMKRAALPPAAPPKHKAVHNPPSNSPLVAAPALTPPAFPPSTAAVEYGGWTAQQQRRSQRTVQAVLKDVPPERYASIVGAPDDAKVTFHRDGGSAVSYVVQHPSLDEMRGRLVRSGDETQHKPDVLYVKASERGKGVGTEIHGRRVAFGVEHGVSRIDISAARGREEVGYIVWPIVGYDGPLPRQILEILPDPLKGRTTVQELLADEAGQLWWKENGKTVNLAFDLSQGSKSIARWTAYWTARSLRNQGR